MNYFNKELYEILCKIFEIYKRDYKKICFESLLSAKRITPYPEIRMTYYKITKKLFKKRFSTNQYMGLINRDRSNYLNYNKMHSDWFETDKIYKRKYKAILKEIYTNYFQDEK